MCTGPHNWTGQFCLRVAKVVAPKKEKLAAAEGEYSELMTGLNQKKAELSAVEANLAALNAKLKEMQVCHKAIPTCTLLSCRPKCRHHVCCTCCAVRYKLSGMLKHA